MFVGFFCSVRGSKRFSVLNVLSTFSWTAPILECKVETASTGNYLREGISRSKTSYHTVVINKTSKTNILQDNKTLGTAYVTLVRLTLCNPESNGSCAITPVRTSLQRTYSLVIN